MGDFACIYTFPAKYTHQTHPHTHKHTYIHTHTHTHTITHPHTPSHTPSHTNTHTYTHTLTNTLTHPPSHTHTHIYIHTHTNCTFHTCIQNFTQNLHNKKEVNTIVKIALNPCRLNRTTHMRIMATFEEDRQLS